MLFCVQWPLQGSEPSPTLWENMCSPPCRKWGPFKAKLVHVSSPVDDCPWEKCRALMRRVGNLAPVKEKESAKYLALLALRTVILNDTWRPAFLWEQQTLSPLPSSVSLTGPSLALWKAWFWMRLNQILFCTWSLTFLALFFYFSIVSQPF